MIRKQLGVLPGSHFFCLTPSDDAKDLYYYLTWSGHYSCDIQYGLKRKYFPYLLMMYVMSGGIEIFYQGGSYLAKKGDIVLLDCQLPHDYHTAKEIAPKAEFYFIHFDGCNSHELCRHIIKQNNGPVFQLYTNRAAAKILLDIFQNCKHGLSICEADTSQMIYASITHLASFQRKDNSQSDAVQQAIRFIQLQTDKKLTLEEIASYVNLSPYYFSRLFKKETGYSPVEFSLIVRINAAKTLLQTTDLSIKAIALQIGYENCTSFINYFTQKVEMSPSCFRKMIL